MCHVIYLRTLDSVASNVISWANPVLNILLILLLLNQPAVQPRQTDSSRLQIEQFKHLQL